MQPSPATPEALLEHLDWVRQLARSLVADPNTAEDLVQETWISAARRPPHTGNLRGWLAQVVRNAARDLRRKESRRALHEERAAKREGTSSGDDLADRVATQQRLVQCVLQLDDPYRETVLLRYFQELAPSDIAERMGVPVATVKTRLRRALAELRTRLDRENGGDGRAWLLALMPLTQTPAALGSASTGTLLIMSTKTIALVAASLILVGVGLFFLTRDGVEPDSVRLAARAEVGDIATEVARPIANANETLTAVDSAAARVATAPTGRRVLVVDKSTGAPVPGAEVWHFEADWNVWNDRVTDRELYMHAHGTKLLADGAGELRLPALERPLAAVARDGDQYGERILYATSPEPIRLEISPDVSLRIQVVDETGQPVPGVNVGLRRRVPVVRGDLGGSLTPVSASALTQSPDGFATLVHFHQRSPDFLEAGSWGIAAVDAPLAPTVQAEFDPRDPPAEPLQLVLPPTGRLVVLVQDAQGRPLPDNWVQVTPIVSESAEAGRDALGLRADTVSRRGRAEFPHVGLGLALQIESQPSTEWPRQEIRCAGPRTAGEEVVVTLRFDERHPVITGRLVDASGAIRAREQLSGRIVLERRDAALQELRLHDRTDGEGRFRIAIATPCEPEVHCTLHVRTGDSAAGNVLTAEIAPVDPLRAEDVNVGDVVLTAPVIALSGTVRDADGKPIYWAWVDIARKQVPNEPQRPVTYDYLSNRRAMSDKAGRFTVSGELEPGEYLVDVAANGFVHTGLRPFTPGTQGRDVVLERHGELEGSVLLPAGVAADRIVVEVSPSEADRDRAREADPDPRAWTGGSSHALPTGAFRLIEVPPGVVDVRVRLDGEIEPLTRIDGVAVTAGSASTDPRLRPIDLRGIVLRQIEVTIEGPDGARVHSAVVAVRPTGDADADARRILCEDGQLTVVSRWSALDLEVRAPGMRVVRREAVTTDQRVVMEPGIPITVRLPAEFQMPAAPLDLTLMLCPVANFRASFEERLYDEAEGREHQHYQWWAGQAQSFDARRELNFRLPEPGSYQVSWLLVQRSGLQGERWASVRDRREPAETTILESDAGKVIELAPDPPDFVAAQGRMR